MKRCGISLLNHSGISTEDMLQSLAEQVTRFRSQGPMILCGDYNARCGRIDADCEGTERDCIFSHRKLSGE